MRLNLNEIPYIDRASKTARLEKIYGGFWLRLLTGNPLGRWLASHIARRPFFSRMVGNWQRQGFTRHKIPAFISRFEIDPSEFVEPVSGFKSFNDFFIRHLTPASRPINAEAESAIIPADGRYKFFEKVGEHFPLFVKGNEVSLRSLLPDQEIIKPYLGGTLVLGRLSPVDCHRFYSPDNAVAGAAEPIKGLLYPVNPLATRQSGSILARNRKVLVQLKTKNFGQILLLAIGATCVGTIHMTYSPGVPLQKGEEIGYYSFGGSAIIMLFAPDALRLATDLKQLAEQPLEIYCRRGELLGQRGLS